MTDVAVVGPGAIGATFAAAAERAGRAVALCGRRPGPAPVVEPPDGVEHRVAGHVRGDVGVAGHVAWVLLAVKTHQTTGTVGLARALMRSRHGYRRAPERRRARGARGAARRSGDRLARDRVVPAETVAPGRVRQRERAQLSVPATPAGAALAALLGDAARVDCVADFRTEAWRKLCLNAAVAPMVRTGRRAEVFRELAAMALARRLAEESVAVGRAEGARLGPETVEAIVARIAALAPDQGTLMLFDRLAGRRMEWTPATA